MGGFAWLPGEQVKFHLRSADATVVAAINIYTPDNVARTLAADERLVIDTFFLSGVGTAEYDLFDDADGGGTVGAGEQLITRSGVNAAVVVALDFAAAGGLPCGKGRAPKFLSTFAGIVALCGVGRITKG